MKTVLAGRGAAEADALPELVSTRGEEQWRFAPTRRANGAPARAVDASPQLGALARSALHWGATANAVAPPVDTTGDIPRLRAS